MEFDRVVAVACEELPAWVQELLEETGIGIYVQETPPPGVKEKFGEQVFGIFSGRKYSAQRSKRPTTQPTRIEIYKQPILARFSGRGEDREELIKQQVRKTVVHEVGHYLGMSEEEIRQKGY